MMTGPSLVSLTPEETAFASPYAPWGMKSGQRSWYHERTQGRVNLLITAGDSWTWGDSLNPKRHNSHVYREYHVHRKQHIYGTLLAEKLKSDHINLARSDASNLDILSYLARVMPAVRRQYQKIFVVVTLTENHRETLTIDNGCNYSSLQQLMCDQERHMMQQFVNLLADSPNVSAVLARNFTHSFLSNIEEFRALHADRAWVDLLAERQDIGPYPTPLRVLTMSSYANLENAIYNASGDLIDTWDGELKQLFQQTLAASAWLDRSSLNYNMATRHPTEDAHQIWADYLYRALADKYSL
jgi:hypothetical protein